MIKFGPKAQLTAIVDNWAPYYIERVQAVLDGTWKSDRHLGRPRARTWCVMAPFTNMPDDVKKMARRPKRRSRPARCIRSSARCSTRTARPSSARAATHLDDGQILGMNFYVKGIDDKLPGK